jgi:N-acetylmuramoyl-L-alanine amidase
MGKKILLLLWITFGFAVALSAANKKFTLVIDAGHGGHDAGAVGAISKEKNLTLRYALAFGAIVERNCPDVKVVYTRKTDVFVELWRRAEIANKAKADLFVSVHINAVARGRNARGYQTYTLGKGTSGTAFDTNLDVAKRENGVILMEPNYQQRYQGYDPNSPESDIMFEFIQDNNMERSVELSKLMQRFVCKATGRQDMGAHQKNLAVLRLSAMPGCLMELGFISTPDEEQFMNSDEALKLYTKGFYNAFMAYKQRYNDNITVPYEPDDTPIEIPSVVPPSVEPVAEPTPKPATVTPVEPVAPVMSNTEVTPAPEVTSPTAETPSPATGSDVPVFKVQIVASSSRLKSTAPQFKGVQNVDCYEDGGMYKYTVGASEDYNEINRLRKELSDKFPQAFVIAFRNGQRCDVQQAIQEFRKRRVRK